MAGRVGRDRRWVRESALLCLAALLWAPLAVLAPAASAAVPFPQPPPGSSPYDYPGQLFVDDGRCDGSANDLPGNFDCVDDWKFTDDRADEGPADAGQRRDPQEFFGVKGTGLNRAWEVSTGRPDVVIAVLDSGIRWEEAQPQLIRKYHLNRGELPVPAGGPNGDDWRFGGYDVNGDGAFNSADYAAGMTLTWHGERVRLTEFADDANRVLDPADLVRVFSDGVDDDGNGYVDDISGWDFFESDNNPLDDVDYGHGTGEAHDSTAEADLAGHDEIGTCPNCMMMPLRVGDSLVADVNHFAEAVVYAADNGAQVVQEALGTLNHTSYGQAALDYAYRRGVIVIASAADEAAAHHNRPAAYEHTMVVNSIRNPSVPATKPNSYLYLNGCTNFGGYAYVSIPSTSCSSEATGRSAGYSGLLQSAARNAVERGVMTPYLRYRKGGYAQARFPLSAEEAYQLWRLSADDIDFASGCPALPGRPPAPQHEFCDETPPYAAPGDAQPPAAGPDSYATTLPGSTRYQTVRGWDYFTGYGRSNVARLLHYLGGPGPDGREGGGDDREYAVPEGDVDGFAPYGSGESPLTAQQRIPPEADISAPRWWAQYPVAADRVLLRPDDPHAPGMVVVEGRVAANRVTSAGGSYDYVLEWAPHAQGLKTGQYAAAGGYRPARGSGEGSHGPWHVVTRVADRTEPYRGELGRIPVRRLLGALADAPHPFDQATDPTSRQQPERHAIRLRVRVIAHPAVNSDGNPANDDRVNNEAVRQKQIDLSDELAIRDDLGVGGRAAGGAGSPSFHDVNGDGEDELLLPTSDGLVHAYSDLSPGAARSDAELPGWPVRTDRYAGVAEHLDGDNAYSRGAVPTDVHAAILGGTVAVADLDDDGETEVLASALDGKLYAWGPDGTRRAGFPVSVDPRLSREVRCGPDTIPYCDDFAASADAGQDSPPNPDVSGDGRAEVIQGSAVSDYGLDDTAATATRWWLHRTRRRSHVRPGRSLRRTGRRECTGRLAVGAGPRSRGRERRPGAGGRDQHAALGAATRQRRRAPGPGLRRGRQRLRRRLRGDRSLTIVPGWPGGVRRARRASARARGREW